MEAEGEVEDSLAIRLFPSTFENRLLPIFLQE